MPQSLSKPYAIELAPTGERMMLRTADATSGSGENTVGRTLAELEILLSPLLAGDAAREDRNIRHWPLRQTVGFIVASCGLFWVAAALAAWSLL